MTQRVLVIYNPTAGRRRQKRLAHLLQKLRAMDIELETCATTRAGHAREVALTCQHIDVIVAAGGDGTVNEVVDGLCAPENKSPSPVVAFFPMGTANVLTVELGLPQSVDQFCAALKTGNTLDIVPGVANDRRFVLMASCGLDARAVAGVRPALKKIWGGAAYVWAAVEALFRPFPHLNVRVDGKTSSATTVIVTRARCYGGPFVIAPDARLDGKTLYAILMKSSGLFASIKYGIALALGRLPGLADVEVLSGSRISIDGPVTEPVQIDGDVLEHLPVTIRLSQKTIRLLIS